MHPLKYSDGTNNRQEITLLIVNNGQIMAIREKIILTIILECLKSAKCTQNVN